MAWHELSAEEALRRLGSAARGLEPAEAARRLGEHGRNVFRAVRAVSAWTILLAQLRSVMVVLLVAAGAVALASGDPLDAIAIGAVLLLNVAIGFFTEFRAHRAMEALLGLEVSRARVIRGGALQDVDARELVPGDVIEVEAGQRIPADARLLETAELRVVEAPLTGEPAPVDKAADGVLAAGVPVAERVTMVYKATTAVAGRGRAVVVATGMRTEVGRIGALAGSVVHAPTPLERRLDALGRRLALVALAVAVAVVALGMLHGEPLARLLQTGIALAVAAVPEGLPAVATITMAVGMRRMARRQALIRRLPAVETLGSATIICSDKTGTLTAGEMTATVVQLPDREITVSGVGYAPVGEFREGGRPVDPARDACLALALRIGALANRSGITDSRGTWSAIGDPTEAALLTLARKGGLDREQLLAEWPEAGEVPFTSRRLLMATFHRTPAGLQACVKGAPRRVLDLSDRVLDGGGSRSLGPEEREHLLALNAELASRGLRVIALATTPVRAIGEGELHGLTFVGFVGLTDPAAAGVTETIDAFRGAGIRTVMLTGDQRLTAQSVARELGLIGPQDEAVEGAELEALADSELGDRIASTAAFSRVSPEAKLRIVAAYQGRGEIVAMLGDGVNDAPALRKADLGVAMGVRGTDLAKEAADLVLADDRFATVAAAVEEGRIIFDNIRKFVFYLFSCNLGEILVLFGAALAGLPAPLLPLQILWLNLLTDTFPALALAVEPGEPDVMRQPPRDPRAALLSRRMVGATVGYGLAIAAASLAAFGWGLARATPAHASTLAFVTLAFAQILHLGNARAEAPVLSPARVLRNRWAVAMALLAAALQVAAMHVPVLARTLQITALDGREWAAVVGLAAMPAVLGQALKAIKAGRVPAAR
ncbi:MAG TPA: cation-translocating P-type ATPase [Gemmatimonadales bacterium]|nr:cation-translocating P-type ATPase [Gemmatimonadales bacterium]